MLFLPALHERIKNAVAETVAKKISTTQVSEKKGADAVGCNIQQEMAQVQNP